jgi:hypothetical protein
MPVYIRLGIRLQYRVRLEASAQILCTQPYNLRVPRAKWRAHEVHTIGAPMSTSLLTIYEQPVGF